MNKLTKERALLGVLSIKEEEKDYEVAHGMEDDLYAFFITCISQGAYNTKKEIEEVAKIILKTKEMEFTRWCA